VSRDLKPAVGIIPSRYSSTRFPGKPLAPILGKPMIQRVYEGAMKAKLLERVIIATDDERIFHAAESFGAEAWMTSPHHTSGTERICEVAQKLKTGLVINIQGDEPLLQGKMIDGLVVTLQEKSIPMASLMIKDNDPTHLHDSNIVKVVVDKNDYALYFSRSALPFQPSDFFFRHIGIYGYQRDFLLKFSQLPPSRLEKEEKLEQLRALENGYKIKMVETEFATLSVDSPQDIIKIEEFLKRKSYD
jgi:3-deoxy-manno-octulosonate cytidylyltransferase (CMP-KDO synthetase)